MGLFDSIGEIFTGGAALGPASLIGGLGAAATLGGSYINARAQGEQNDRNEANTWAMQDRVEKREDTSHQREVADLKAAGLNPILSANKGANSSGQGFSAGIAPQIQFPDIMGAITASDALATSAENRNLTKAQVEKVRAEKRYTEKQTNILEKDEAKASFFEKWWNRLNKAPDTIDKTRKYLNKNIKGNPWFEQKPLRRQRDGTWR